MGVGIGVRQANWAEFRLNRPLGVGPTYCGIRGTNYTSFATTWGYIVDNLFVKI